MGFYSLPLAEGDRVLTSLSEYGSNFLGIVQRTEAAGASLEIVPSAEDGTIDIERLADVVYVGRPTVGQPHSTVTMFRYDPDGKTASRVTVKLGRASVNTIEILDGLKVGDKVILSDMSAQDSHDHIRLN